VDLFIKTVSEGGGSSDRAASGKLSTTILDHELQIECHSKRYLVAWMTQSAGHPCCHAKGEGLRWGEVLLKTEPDDSPRMDMWVRWGEVPPCQLPTSNLTVTPTIRARSCALPSSLCLRS